MNTHDKIIIDNLITSYMNYTVVNNHYVHEHPKLKKLTHKNNELIIKYAALVKTEPDMITIRHTKKLLKRLIKFNKIVIRDIRLEKAPDYKERYIKPRQSTYEYNEHFKEITVSAELLLMKSNI